jgi:diketogulonate reductase-like aldo/keto reductase
MFDNWSLQAVQKSGIAREEIFVTTKIHPRHLGYQATLDAFESSLSNLATEFIDLLLLHYPECWGTLCEHAPEGDWKESWQAMEKLVASGKVLSLGANSSMQIAPHFGPCIPAFQYSYKVSWLCACYQDI